MRREIADGTHRACVREDFATGIRSGVNGTPTFYINGVRHDNDYEFETLLEALEKVDTSGTIV